MVMTRGDHSRARRLRSEGFSLREVGRQMGVFRAGGLAYLPDRLDARDLHRPLGSGAWAPDPGQL